MSTDDMNPQDACCWRVARDDGRVVGTFVSKAKALAAAIRWSVDGNGYCIEKAGVVLPDGGAVLRMTIPAGSGK